MGDNGDKPGNDGEEESASLVKKGSNKQARLDPEIGANRYGRCSQEAPNDPARVKMKDQLSVPSTFNQDPGLVRRVSVSLGTEVSESIIICMQFLL